MIQLGRARGLGDKLVVFIQLVEPQARRRGCEKALQYFYCSGNLGAAASRGEIGASAFCLRPQPGGRIVNRPIDQDRIDRDATAGIESTRIGKLNEPRRRVDLSAASKPGPFIEQKRPFIMMTRLADKAITAGRGRPVRSEELP